MNIEIPETAIKEFLWLQNEIEHVLENETLKRALKAGILPPDTKYLFQQQFSSFYGNITVEYSAPHTNKRLSEEYTLAEALRLCLQQGE